MQVPSQYHQMPLGVEKTQDRAYLSQGQMQPKLRRVRRRNSHETQIMLQFPTSKLLIGTDGPYCVAGALCTRDEDMLCIGTRPALFDRNISCARHSR